jgi:hypothetical protein
MTYIAHLDISLNRTLVKNSWSNLADSNGTPFRDYDGRMGDMQGLSDFVRDAAGMFLPIETFLCDSALVDVIREQIEHGKRLLVRLESDSTDKTESFLEPYGISRTTVAVHDPESKVHPRVVKIDRRTSPQCFKPHELLDAVDSVVIQGPNAIRYRAAASPVLTLPVERLQIVDRETDLFTDDWTTPEISCLVEAVAGTGAILAYSGSFFNEPYVGPLGHSFPGITGEANARLAENVIKWLAGSRNHRPLAEEAFCLTDRIERALVEYTVHQLKVSFNIDWWTKSVPQTVRVKCVTRKEEEGNQLPPTAYFDVLDIKDILEKNWVLFGVALETVGWSGGKSKALSWVKDFNDIRKNVMHPTRRVFSPGLIDSKTISTLRGWLTQVERLGILSARVQ